MTREQFKQIKTIDIFRFRESFNFYPENTRTFYAFNEEQLEEGMKKHGYTDRNELTQGKYGLIGSAEEIKKYYAEFNKRHEIFKEEMKKRFTADQIFLYEANNHESGYTGDFGLAYAITREYFPDYEPENDFLNFIMDID